MKGARTWERRDFLRLAGWALRRGRRRRFGSQRTAAPAPTNIIVLLCDDLGYGDLSCFAHPAIRTPHLDRLAEGLKLTHCCSAARSAPRQPLIPPRPILLLPGRGILE
jgi:hypothetical protein